MKTNKHLDRVICDRTYIYVLFVLRRLEYGVVICVQGEGYVVDKWEMILAVMSLHCLARGGARGAMSLRLRCYCGCVGRKTYMHVHNTRTQYSIEKPEPGWAVGLGWAKLSTRLRATTTYFVDTSHEEVHYGTCGRISIDF
jgi:hypothetical protein